MTRFPSHTRFQYAPRYASGPTASFDYMHRWQIARFAADECAGYDAALSGMLGPELKARAEKLGLDRIVESFADGPDDGLSILDEITGRTCTRICLPATVLTPRHAKRGLRVGDLVVACDAVGAPGLTATIDGRAVELPQFVVVGFEHGSGNVIALATRRDARNGETRVVVSRNIVSITVERDIELPPGSMES